MFTLELKLQIQLYAGFTYKYLIKIIEIIPISGTASSQAERCLGQNVPVPNFKIIQNATPCSYISVTVTKIHNPECSSDVLKLSRYSLKNQQR